MGACTRESANKQIAMPIKAKEMTFFPPNLSIKRPEIGDPKATPTLTRETASEMEPRSVLKASANGLTNTPKQYTSSEPTLKNCPISAMRTMRQP